MCAGQCNCCRCKDILPGWARVLAVPVTCSFLHTRSFLHTCVTCAFTFWNQPETQAGCVGWIIVAGILEFNFCFDFVMCFGSCHEVAAMRLLTRTAVLVGKVLVTLILAVAGLFHFLRVPPLAVAGPLYFLRVNTYMYSFLSTYKPRCADQGTYGRA